MASTTIPTGHLGNLTQEQQAILDKFREDLKAGGQFVPERHDDATLLRFLRARKFNFDLAKQMLLSHEVWRKSFGVDDIVKNFDFHEKAEVNKIYPRFYHKTDLEGRPVYIEQLGSVDTAALNQVTDQSRLLKQLVWEYEKFISDRLPACSAAAGRHIGTSCTIIDLKGVGITKFNSVRAFVQEASAIGQNQYPETMGKFYIINAPYLFSTIWSLIKLWLDPVTVAKISILSSDYKKYLGIPDENLPKFLGGKCECPGGCMMSDAGPWNTVESSAAAPGGSS